MVEMTADSQSQEMATLYSAMTEMIGKYPSNLSPCCGAIGGHVAGIRGADGVFVTSSNAMSHAKSRLGTD